MPMVPMAPAMVILLVALLMPTTLCSRSGPSSKNGHGHAKRAPPPASPSLPPHAPAVPSPPQAAALVRATCNSTAYYDVCVSALAADPSSTTADVRGLSAIAVSVAAANASGAAQAAAALANATAPSHAPLANGTVQALLRTCASKYGDARDALAAAKDSIAQQDYDFASVHVSAATEYPQVCKTLFRRQKPGAYPVELAAREEALNKLCSVALDIIALLSSPSNS